MNIKQSFFKLSGKCALLIASTTLNLPLSSQTQISVDITKKLNQVSEHAIGINTNYLMDGGITNPSIPTADALKSMGIKFLRYPGGEKSDNYLWSLSPWEKPLPHFARKGNCEWPSSDNRFAESNYSTAKQNVLDFDEFITMCKTSGGEPMIVVAYDCMYKASTCNEKIPSLEELLINAEEWVRYSNKVKGYNVKYWMIGNESYMSCDYNGCATATQYKNDIIAFSKRMKKVDPSIKIIANGEGSNWWKTVLPTASYHIDYLGVSNYPVWNYTGGYSYYQNNTPNLMAIISNTKNYLNKFAPKSEKDRIKIITTEFNSMDWSEKWPNSNDMGHALVSFEILAEHLKDPKIESALFWNTRWVNNTTNNSDIYDALDKDGNLLPSGIAISILGNNVLDEMVYTTSTKQIRTFASYSKSDNLLNLFIVNKASTKESISVNINNYLQEAETEEWVMKGNDQNDTQPSFVLKGKSQLSGPKLNMELAGISITLVKLKPANITQSGNGDPNTSDPGNGGTNPPPINNWGPSNRIDVNVNTVHNNVSQKPIGINLNYLTDGGYTQPTISTTEALKNMGVKFLRYPGGEKSDNYLWSVSPWDKADPKFSRTGNCEWPSGDTRFANADNYSAKSIVLDFDEFITMSKSIGGEPLIVVAYDAIYKTSSCNGKIPSKEEVLKNAEEWVRYANKVKGYNIKYWMIGNESYMSCNYNGCASASQYREDVIAFSKRMKAVDPSIKIIANGDGDSWWATVLPAAAVHIDFIGISNYPVWNFTGGYEYYRKNSPDFVGGVKNTINSINKYAPLSERNRLKVITTEYNAIDWSGNWKDANDAGHALASFEVLGEHLKIPQIEAALFWNTRWVNNTTNPNDIYDALKKDGNLQPNGQTLAIFANNLLDQMVFASGTIGVKCYASYSNQTKELNLFIVNKELSSQTANLNLSNYVTKAQGEKWTFKGNSPTNFSTTWEKTGTETLDGSSLNIGLEPVSITLVKFKPISSSRENALISGKNKAGNKWEKKLVFVDLFEMYPNPSKGLVNIKIKENMEAPLEIKVISLQGKELLSITDQGEKSIRELDVSKLDKGPYFVKIISKSKEYNSMLILE